MARNPQFLTHLTSKCVSRHNGVHFFDIKLQSNRQKVVRTLVFLTCSRPNVFLATTACTFSTSPLPKVVRTCGNFDILMPHVHSVTTAYTFLTSPLPKVARPWHFFNVFNTSHFKMCFAAQRRALLRHLNFQKCSETDVFCNFSLPHVLRATTACTFQHLNFQNWSEHSVFGRFSLQGVLRTTTACNF